MSYFSRFSYGTWSTCFPYFSIVSLASFPTVSSLLPSSHVISFSFILSILLKFLGHTGTLFFPLILSIFSFHSDSLILPPSNPHFPQFSQFHFRQILISIRFLNSLFLKSSLFPSILNSFFVNSSFQSVFLILFLKFLSISLIPNFLNSSSRSVSLLRFSSNPPFSPASLVPFPSISPLSQFPYSLFPQ